MGSLKKLTDLGREFLEFYGFLVLDGLARLLLLDLEDFCEVSRGDGLNFNKIPWGINESMTCK